MSSFWAYVRGRRGSSNANGGPDELRPPSGRSYGSESRESQRDRVGDASLDYSPSLTQEIVVYDDSDDKGCMNMSKVRLPSSLKKLRASSASKHRSNGAHTPSPTPDIRHLTPDSASNPKKSFGKRAASTSPARANGRSEKRRPFRGHPADRFVSQIPDQFKHLFSKRKRSSDKENVPEEEQKVVSTLPAKPARKPGPVGRTWVKVFDDIIYMDVVKKGEEPILGYTGRPTKVPDAFPLPVEPLPPTPPPQRSATLQRPREPSVESEYDNVPRRSKSTEAPVVQEHHEPKLVKGKVESSIEEVKVKPVRQGRSRETNRFKGKRQKRMDTPVRSEGLSFQDDEVSDEAVVEVKTESLPEVSPKKPPRGHKIYETIPDAKKDEAVEPSDTPAKPPRGHKIYETIKDVRKDQSIERTVDTSVQRESVRDIPPELPPPRKAIKIYETVEITKEPLVPNESEVSKEIVGVDVEASQPEPKKPKRGIKIYETLPIKKEVEARETSIGEGDNKKGIEGKSKEDEEKREDKVGITEPDLPPSKPSRGQKVYATIMMTVPDDQESLKTTTATDSKDGSTAPYAKVQRDSKTGEMMETQSGAVEHQPDITPPPIPPKKKGIKTIDPTLERTDVLYDIVPPRPPRHLKPYARSLDPSPCRPKRQKIISAEGEKRKIYTGIDFGSPVKPDRKTCTLNDAMLNGFLSQEESDMTKPSKPCRSRLPAPPRKKRQAQETPVTGRLTLGSEKGMTTTSVETEDVEPQTYENVNVMVQSTANVPQHTLVPPHLVAGSSVDTTKQDSYPSITGTAIENGIKARDSDAFSKNAKSVSVDELGGGVAYELTVRELQSDIDLNLRNIQRSCEKLNLVLNTLRSYSNRSPSSLSAGGDFRQSCDVLFDVNKTDSDDSKLKRVDDCVRGPTESDIKPDCVGGSRDVGKCGEHVAGRVAEPSKIKTDIDTGRDAVRECSFESADQIDSSLSSDFESADEEPTTIIENLCEAGFLDPLKTSSSGGVTDEEIFEEEKPSEDQKHQLTKVSDITCGNIAEIHLETPVSESDVGKLEVTVKSVSEGPATSKKEESVTSNDVIEQSAKASSSETDHGTSDSSVGLSLTGPDTEPVQSESSGFKPRKRFFYYNDAKHNLEKETGDAEIVSDSEGASGKAVGRRGKARGVGIVAEELTSKILSEVENKLCSEENVKKQKDTVDSIRSSVDSENGGVQESKVLIEIKPAESTEDKVLLTHSVDSPTVEGDAVFEPAGKPEPILAEERRPKDDHEKAFDTPVTMETGMTEDQQTKGCEGDAAGLTATVVSIETRKSREDISTVGKDSEATTGAEGGVIEQKEESAHGGKKETEGKTDDLATEGDLEVGVSALASRLEGIRSQLEAVITNYPVFTPPKSNTTPPSTASIRASSLPRSSADYAPAEGVFSIPFFYSGPFLDFSQDQLTPDARASHSSTPQTFYTAVSRSASLHSDPNDFSASPSLSLSPSSSPPSSTPQKEGATNDSSSAEENLAVP